MDTSNLNDASDFLEEAGSLDQLSQLMQIVKPKNWVPVLTVAGLTTISLGWSVVGRLPMTVEGKGVLISPQQVVELQSPVSGQLEVLNIQDGQRVRQGSVIAAVKPLELEEQLKQLQAKRQQLLGQIANTASIRQQRTQAEQQAIGATRSSLLQRLQDAQTLSPTLREQSLQTIAQQRQSLQNRLNNAEAMAVTLKDRRDQRATLLKEGALAQDTVLAAEREYLQEMQTIEDLRAQLQQLAVNATQTQQRYAQEQSTVGEVQAQLEELTPRTKRLEQENVQDANVQMNEVAEVDRAIAQLKQQIEEKSAIRSPQDGTVLEMSGVLGQVVTAGTRLGTLQMGGAEPAVMMGVAYFDVKDGKQIKPGMKVQITPETVRRERFGGIVGVVKAVSPYPVTSSRAGARIGNLELADGLTEKSARVEVEVELQVESNNPSGYRWSSSKGPDSPLTTGTTAAVRVMVEERAPITFLLPFLREWSGFQ
jgi:HlyD family secretion protein